MTPRQSDAEHDRLSIGGFDFFSNIAVSADWPIDDIFTNDINDDHAHAAIVIDHLQHASNSRRYLITANALLAGLIHLLVKIAGFLMSIFAMRILAGIFLVSPFFGGLSLGLFFCFLLALLFVNRLQIDFLHRIGSKSSFCDLAPTQTVFFKRTSGETESIYRLSISSCSPGAHHADEHDYAFFVCH